MDNVIETELDSIREARQQRDDLADRIAGSVVVARANGASWQDVANALGVTKQAAQKRYGVTGSAWV